MKTIRIFISSPSDVAKERERAREVVESLRRRYSRHFLLEPVLWEDLPLQSDASFQQGIDAVLSEKGADIAIFILWSRLGSPLGKAIPRPDGTPYRSGTEREYDLMEKARAASLAAEGVARPHLLVYTRRDDASFVEAMRGTSTQEKEELIRQKKLVEQFLSENFKDQDTGHNIGAFFPFDRPTTFSHRLRTHLQNLLDQMAGESTEVIWDIEKQGPPFLGLEAFQPQHAPVFFGREEEILEARRALKEQARDGCAFLLLSGASGSGKSSLARAGVMPAITELEVDEQVAGWRSLVITPAELGSDPITAFVARLAATGLLDSPAASAASLTDLAAGLKKAPELTFSLRLKDAFAQAAARHGGAVRLLLLLDQLEELFNTSTLSPADRAAFLAVVETFARSGSVWVLATVRSDFYQQVQMEPVLVRMKSGHGQLDVLPPGPDALQRLIEEPARLAGLIFEKRGDQSLSSRIIRDAASHAELLPLVEFVLRELYENRSATRQLTCAAYEALGGVEGALAKRADETHAALPGDAQESLASVLQALVTLDNDASGGGGEKIIRQRAPLAEFDTKPSAKALVEAFITARLFTTCQIEATGEPAITVAHESLLRVWPRAMQWAENNKDLLRTRARIAARIKEGSPLLAGDPLLESAKFHLTAESQAFNTVQKSFVRDAITSIAAEETRRNKRRRTVMATLCSLTLLAAAGGIFGWVKAKQAQTNAQTARAQEAKAKKEAARADAEGRKATEQARLASNADLASALKAWQEDFNARQKGDYAEGYQGKSRWHEAVALLVRSLQRDPTNQRAAAWLYDTILHQGGARRDFPTMVLRHEDVINSACFNSDGTRLVTASDDGTARVWDANSGKPIGESLRHNSQVASACFSPDGTRVITGSSSAQIWDAKTGTPIGKPFRRDGITIHACINAEGTRVLTLSHDWIAQVSSFSTGEKIGDPMIHDENLRSGSFSPDGKLVYTTTNDRTRIWDANTGRAIGEPIIHEGPSRRASFSKDGKFVLTTSWDKAVWISDAISGKRLGEPLRHHEDFSCASFSPDGTRIVTGSYDNTAQIWNTSTRGALGEPLRHDDEVINAFFSPDGTRVATVCKDKTVRVWDVITGQPCNQPFRHDQEISNAIFSPDGTRILTTSKEEVRLWDVGTRKPIGMKIACGRWVNSAAFSHDGTRIIIAINNHTVQIRNGVTGEIVGNPFDYDDDAMIGSASFSPDGSRFTTESRYNLTRAWDAITGKPIGTPIRQNTYAFKASFSPDGRKVITITGGQSLRILDSMTGNPIGGPFEFDEMIKITSFSPDSRRVAIAHGKTAQVWDDSTGKTIGPPLKHDSEVRAVAFSPQGNRIVTADINNSARLWDVITGKPIGPSFAHHMPISQPYRQYPIDCPRFSPDGNRVITLINDVIVRVWDINSGKVLSETLQHDAPVSSACFSSDGTRLITASDDFTARLWDAMTGQPIGEPLRHDGDVSSAEFSPDGSCVVTGSLDGIVRIWTVQDTRIYEITPEVLTWASALIGLRYNETGQLQKISEEEQIKIFNRSAKQLPTAWKRLSNSLFTYQ